MQRLAGFVGEFLFCCNRMVSGLLGGNAPNNLAGQVNTRCALDHLRMITDSPTIVLYGHANMLARQIWGSMIEVGQDVHLKWDFWLAEVAQGQRESLLQSIAGL